jgi:hypothetical protein
VRILPDVDLLLWPHAFKGSGPVEAWVVSGTAVTVVPGIESGQLVDGHMVYLRRGANRGLWAVPFDLTGRRTSGEPFPVAPGAGAFGVAGRELLVYRIDPGDEARVEELVWIDDSGAMTALPGPRASAQVWGDGPCHPTDAAWRWC